MRARDIMVSSVVTTTPHSTIKDAAKTLLSHHISALPVVDSQAKLVGIISEGDLFRRAETGTERTRSWWLQTLSSANAIAADYVKAHARKVEDVMSRHVITASPETALHEIAALLETHAIKRVPICENGQLVGIAGRPRPGACRRGKQAGNTAVGYDHPEQIAVALAIAALGRRGNAQCHRHRRRGRSVGRCALGYRTQGDPGCRRSNAGH